MNWIASSIRNKILAGFVLGIALVTAGGVYGFVASRSGLAAVARVNDTLIAQAIEAQALEATFKEQVQQWMSVLVRGHDPQALDKSWNQFTFREREVRRGGEKLRQTVELAAARDLLDKFLAAHTTMGDKYRQALKLYQSSGFDARKSDASVRGIDTEPSELIEEVVRLLRDEAQTALGGARQQATQGLGRSLGVIAVATGEGERRKRSSGRGAWLGSLRDRREGRQSDGRIFGDDGRYRQRVQEDRRHHRVDQQHCVPDQHSGTERRRGSGARGRAGPGFCRGRRRGAGARATQRRGCEGDQGPGPELGGQSRRGYQARGGGWQNDGRDRRVGQTSDGSDVGNQGGDPGATLRNRASERGDDAYGSGCAAGCRGDGGIGRCRAGHGGSG